MMVRQLRDWAQACHLSEYNAPSRNIHFGKLVISLLFNILTVEQYGGKPREL